MIRGIESTTTDDYLDMEGRMRAIVSRVKSYHRNADFEKLWRAFHLGRKAHEGQKRRSGEPYFTHALSVAEELTELRLDVETIVAGLLHDTVEDTGISLADLQRDFGEEVALLVDGVTKIGEIHYENPEAQQAENYRKLLLTIAKDIRVILIKLADRMHNMATLDSMPEERRLAIAQETLNVYAPLAHRFGIARVKWELEDMGFKTLHSDEYQKVQAAVNAKREEREKMLQEFQRPLMARLEEAGIKAKIQGRPKHFYSIWKKMQSQGSKSIEQIYDLLAVRILVNTTAECYHALGVVHSTFNPIHDRIKDYIAAPKVNLYQSLHTTVHGPNGHLYEVQIRTHQMHRRAEIGIAAHWRYKEGMDGQLDERMNQQLRWFREVLDWQRDVTDPREFMDALKIDLFEEEVYVFSPAGDLFRLPHGSTPLDFAFRVHSEVGLHCSGARVEGRLVPLRYELKSGETVEIVTRKNAQPSHHWLDIVKTSRAKHHIRHWMKAHQVEQSIRMGREMIERELKKRHVKLQLDKELIEVAQALGHQEVSRLLAAVGRGTIPLQRVVNRIAPGEQKQKRVSLPQRLQQALKRRSHDAVRIQGLDNLMVHFAKCCQPVPGDAITGIVSIGHGVSIHRVDCNNVRKGRIDEDRRIEVEWDVPEETVFPVQLSVIGEDRKNLLADISRSIADLDCNIQAGTFEGSNEYARCTFMVEVRNLHHLSKIIGAISKISSVSRVERTVFVQGNLPPEEES